MKKSIARLATATLLVALAACGGATSSNRDNRNAALEDPNTTACVTFADPTDWAPGTLGVNATVTCEGASSITYHDLVDGKNWQYQMMDGPTFTLEVPQDGGEFDYSVLDGNTHVLEAGSVKVDASVRTLSVTVTGGSVKQSEVPDTTIATGDTSAADKPCINVEGGAVDEADGTITFDFCEKVTNYTVMKQDMTLPIENLIQVGSNTQKAADLGSKFIVLASSASDRGYMDGTYVDRVMMTVNEDNTVTVEEFPHNITRTECLRIDQGEVMASSVKDPVLIIPATVTCEGASLVYYDDMVYGGRTNSTVEGGHFQITAPINGATSSKFEVRKGSEVLDSGTLYVPIAPFLVNLVSAADNAAKTTDTTVPSSDTTNPGTADTTPAGSTDTTVASSDTTAATADSTVPASDTTAAAQSTETTLPTLASVFGPCGEDLEIVIGPGNPNSADKTVFSYMWNCFAETDGSIGIGYRLLDSAGNQIDEDGFGEDLPLRDSFRGGEAYDPGTRILENNSLLLEAGKYTFVVDTTVSREVEGQWVSYDNQIRKEFVVAPAEGGYTQCRKDRITYSDGHLTLDCSYDEVRMLTVDDHDARTKGQTLDVSELPDGWNDVVIATRGEGVDFFEELALCNTQCDKLPAMGNVTRTVDGGTWNFEFPPREKCAEMVYEPAYVIEFSGGDDHMSWANWHEWDSGENYFVHWNEEKFSWVPHDDARFLSIASQPIICNDADGNEIVQYLYTMWNVSGTPDESGQSTDTTAVPSTDAVASLNMPAPVMLPVPTAGAGEPPKVVVSSESAQVTVSPSVVEAVLATVPDALPFVYVSTSDGAHSMVRKASAGHIPVTPQTESVTLTVFDKKGKKTESTIKVLHSVPLVTITGGEKSDSGFPVIPVAVVVALMLAAGAVWQVRRKPVA